METTGKYKCKDCGKIFNNSLGNSTCPNCKSVNTEMVIED